MKHVVVNTHYWALAEITPIEEPIMIRQVCEDLLKTPAKTFEDVFFTTPLDPNSGKWEKTTLHGPLTVVYACGMEQTDSIEILEALYVDEGENLTLITTHPDTALYGCENQTLLICDDKGNVKARYYVKRKCRPVSEKIIDRIDLQNIHPGKETSEVKVVLID